MKLLNNIEIKRESHFVNKSDFWVDFNIRNLLSLEIVEVDGIQFPAEKLHKYLILDFGIKRFPVNITIRLKEVKK